MQSASEMTSLSIAFRFRVLLKTYLSLLLIVFFALIFHWLSSDTFLTSRNLSNLSRQVCVNLTLAIGMTFVIITSGIDLSIGSLLALSGMVAAISQVHFHLSDYGTLGALSSFLISMSVGGACGALTGFIVTRFHITPFIVTLGMMVICRGLTLIVSKAQAVAPIGESLGALSTDYLSIDLSAYLLVGVAFFLTVFNTRKIIGGFSIIKIIPNFILGLLFCLIAGLVFCQYRGIPYMVFIALICALLGHFILTYTRLGRFIYAIGGNREAAHLSGIPVNRTLFISYFLMGILSALAGVMDVARVNGAVPSAGELAELDAIAAVVIGGTSLRGGVGKISGTLFGVLILGILNNGFSLMGISEHYQKVFKGFVIIFAVFLDLRSKKNQNLN